MASPVHCNDEMDHGLAQHRRRIVLEIENRGASRDRRDGGERRKRKRKRVQARRRRRVVEVHCRKRRQNGCRSRSRESCRL